MRFPWPGNVREMENKLKRAMVLATGLLITSQDLELNEQTRRRIMKLDEAKDELLGNYIDEILALNNGNREQTARDLGVAPRTIYRHLEKRKKGE
jgi:DNA-binding NtrC family response regulator